MQNRIGDIARHRHDRDPLTNKEDEVDSRGGKRKRRDEKGGNGESTGTCGEIAVILLAQQCKSV